MPSGRDPNQTFVNENARSSKRGVLIPLLIVGLLVVGGGLLIAWGLNSFFPGLLGGKSDTPVAAEATPTPTSAVVATTPEPTPTPGTSVAVAPTATPNTVAVVPPIPTPPAVTAVPKVTDPPVAGTAPVTRPTAVQRPDLRVESTPRPTSVASADPTPPGEIFRRAVPPETSTVPTPPVVAKLQPTPTPAPTGPAFPRMAEIPTSVPAPPSVTSRPSLGTPPTTIDTDLRNPENAVIKDEVLKRIDQMPDLTPENRDKLYNRVERTPGMGRVATIFFEVGETGMRPIDVARLRDELEEGPARKLLDDPTVVFVVLGYADKTGGVEVNKRISQARANAAVNVMRNQLKLANAMHAVAMGASTMFGTGREQYEKNRVVEVWAVLP